MRTTALSLLPLGVSLVAGCATIMQTLQPPKPVDPNLQPRKEEGILGTLQSAHLGQVVFASTAIPPNADASFALADHVRADQPIYTRMFLPHSPHNMWLAATKTWCPQPEMWVHVDIDGAAAKGLWEENLIHHDEGRDQAGPFDALTTISLDDDTLLKTGDVDLPADVTKRSAELVRLVSQLAPGSHQLGLTVRMRCDDRDPKGTDLAKGTVALDVDAKSKAALAARLHLAKNDPSHPAAELRTLRKLAADGTNLVDFRAIYAWVIVYRDSGIPKERALRTEWVTRTADGCALRGKVFYEQYEGAGTYGAPMMRDGQDSDFLERTVPCEVAR